MNRCFAARPARAWVLGLALSLASAATLAQTLGRTFPPATRIGTLSVTQPPEVLLDGQPDRLSPGARIRSVNQLLVLSGTLVGLSVPVRYLREPHGLLHEVWILSEDEVAAARRNQEMR